MKDFIEVACIAVGAGGVVALAVGSVAYDFATVYSTSQSTQNFFDTVSIVGAFAATAAIVLYTLTYRK